MLYNVVYLYAVLHRTGNALRCLRKVVRSGWRKEDQERAGAEITFCDPEFHEHRLDTRQGQAYDR